MGIYLQAKERSLRETKPDPLSLDFSPSDYEKIPVV